MGKKGKYNTYKVEAWDDSEGVLTKDQIEYLIQDEQRMQAEEIAEALEDSNKLFNSVHIKYETNDPNATTEPVTDTELDEALYFLEDNYVESSPLTYEQKINLSKSEVGDSELVGDGLLSFMKHNSYLPK